MQKETKDGQASTNWAPLIRACLVEFIGDFIFVFVGSLQGASGGGIVAAALTHGIAIAVLIASMGHISGGHFNPAVTTGVVIAGGIPIVNAVAYVVSQLLGGTVGAFLVRVFEAVTHGPLYISVLKGGVTIPAPTTFAIEGITCEAIATFFLVGTVLLTAVDADSNLLAPLAIGLSITVDTFGIAAVSGASMNPARSFGPALVFSVFGPSQEHWHLHHIYWIGPLLGAAVAGFLHRCSSGGKQESGSSAAANGGWMNSASFVLTQDWLKHHAHWIGPIVCVVAASILYRAFLGTEYRLLK